MVRQVPLRIAAADANPKSRKPFRPQRRDNRRQPVVPAVRAFRPRPQPPDRQIHVVAHHQQVGELDFVKPQQRNHGFAAEIHEGGGFDEPHPALGPPPFGRLRQGPPRLQLQSAPGDQDVHDLEAHVVPRPPIATARVAETNDELHTYFFSFSSLSTLPFFITSGSAAAAGAAATAPSSGVATTSARGATTCTISMSGSLRAFHLPSAGRSRTRIPWPIISSVTSSVICSGISAGRHSTSTSRCTKSSVPPCTLTPLASPSRCTGMVTVSNLSMATRKKSA